MNSIGKLVMESILETKASTILQFIRGLRSRDARVPLRLAGDCGHALSGLENDHLGGLPDPGRWPGLC